MHDEVSETENIRKNLAIERMIIEGCDILLDVNQTFVRQGQSAYCVCPLGVRLCVYVLSVVWTGALSDKVSHSVGQTIVSIGCLYVPACIC